MDELVGHKILSVLSSDDKSKLAFEIDPNHYQKTQICYIASGDCCSSSWIEHIMGIQSLLGQTVIRVTTDYFGEEDENDNRDDLVQCYGWTIFTDIGRC